MPCPRCRIVTDVEHDECGAHGLAGCVRRLESFDQKPLPESLAREFVVDGKSSEKRCRNIETGASLGERLRQTRKTDAER